MTTQRDPGAWRSITPPIYPGGLYTLFRLFGSQPGRPLNNACVTKTKIAIFIIGACLVLMEFGTSHMVNGAMSNVFWECTSVGPCKPKSESWIPPKWNVNPESQSFWNMNPRKLIRKALESAQGLFLNYSTTLKFHSGPLNPRKLKNALWNLNPESDPFWHLNPESLVCLKFESRIPGAPPLQGLICWFGFNTIPTQNSNQSIF